MRRIAKGVHDFLWVFVVAFTCLILSVTDSKKFKRINWNAVSSLTLLVALATVIYSLYTCREVLKDLFIGVCVIFVINTIVIVKLLRKQ